MDFEENFWSLVKNHGRVAHLYKSECEDLWTTFSPEQQQAICQSIKEKLTSGRFVSFRPTDAMKDNAPKPPKQQVLSYDEHYRRFGTDIPQGGFRKIFLPDQQKTIYIKN